MIDSELIQAAFSNISTQVIGFLPALVTALVILLLGWLVARTLASMARRVADRLGIDRRFEGTGLSAGLAQAQVERSPTDLIAALVFWLVFLSAALIALDSLGISDALLPLQGLIAYLPRILAAILIVIVGAVLAQWAGQAAQAAVASMGVEYHRQIGRAVRLIFLVAFVVIAFQQLGIDLSLFTGTFINLVTIAAAGIALAFALGGREIIHNILAGFYAKDIYQTGDTLLIDDLQGTLEAIGTLSAEIAMGEDTLVLPNSRLIDKQVRVMYAPKDSQD